MKRYSIAFILLSAIGLMLCSIAQNIIVKTGPIKKCTVEIEGKYYKVDYPDADEKREAILTGAKIAMVGLVLITIGCCSQAYARGRSPAWGLFGILSPLGILIIATLKDKQPGNLRPAEAPDKELN
ncbi:hypothetical protein P4C99_18510 [Pontiellaceae bacterium B1224]|nr:hypothetical protein [Pontiellaceae bacterium B1224]